MGEMKSALRATLEQFHAFREARPKEEKWELIDGVMTMMPPPSLVHQCISGNLDRLLYARIEDLKLPWRPDREVGILLPDDDRYNPEPDVIVVDAFAPFGQIYAEKFYFVAEILSPHDKANLIDLKRAFYQGHAHCRCVMFVRQDRMAAEVAVREGTGWRVENLDQPGAAITVPDLGTIGTLGALYRHTPLQPAV